MLPQEHREALRIICECLAGPGLLWAVTGSTALAAQGLPVEPHDIDLQSDAEGAYLVEKALAPYMVRPVAYSSTDRIRSHFGAATVCELQVEIMGDVEVRRPDGTWRPPPDMDSRIWVETADLRLPVLSLEHEHEAYRLMGRSEKAEMLRRHLESGKRV